MLRLTLILAYAVVLAAGCGRTGLASRADLAPAPADSPDSGPDLVPPDALAAGFSATNDDALPTRVDTLPVDAGPPMLSLLAGGLGGEGNIDGIGPGARFFIAKGITSDGAGNLFVADSQNSTIRKVAIASGAVTTLAGLAGNWGVSDGTGAAARFGIPQAVASDGMGSLFVSDMSNHTIRKVAIATGAVTTLAGSPGKHGNDDGAGSAARFWNPQGVAYDGAGNLFVADSGNHTIRKIVIATGVVTTIAGASGIDGSADGTGSAARFLQPAGVTTDGAGNLFVADSGNHTIRTIVIAKGVATTLAGDAGNAGNDDGLGKAARFNSPQDVTSDGVGNLFVADSTNHTIRKVVIATRVVTTLAGPGVSPLGDDGIGAVAQFTGPNAVFAGGAGILFVSDASTIRKVVVATGAVTTIAGSAHRHGHADGIGLAAQIGYSPPSIVSDGVGNLFVLDAGNETIRRLVIATGEVTTLAGSPETTGIDNGPGSSAQFRWPGGMASDGVGNLYVADSGNQTIRKVVVATGAVTTFAGSPGTSGSNDGVGTAARFGWPTGVASDGAGNLFVTDQRNSNVRKIVLATGAVTTLAGSAGMSGIRDGRGADAWFSYPAGVAADRAGNLFVAEHNSHVIRKVIVATSEVTTVAGSPEIPGHDDGKGAKARFKNPTSLALDGAGNLFVADSGNSTIRKIVIATGEVSTVVGSPMHTGVVLGPLPAGLNSPQGLALGPAGQLFISDEHVILMARF